MQILINSNKMWNQSGKIIYIFGPLWSKKDKYCSRQAKPSYLDCPTQLLDSYSYGLANFLLLILHAVTLNQTLDPKVCMVQQTLTGQRASVLDPWWRPPSSTFHPHLKQPSWVKILVLVKLKGITTYMVQSILDSVIANDQQLWICNSLWHFYND